MRIDLDNGKYSLVQADNGLLSALRHGQPWDVMTEAVQFSHFHAAIYEEIVELRRRSEGLRAELGHLELRLYIAEGEDA